MPPADGRPTLRELSKPPQFLPLSSPNGKQLESGSPRQQQRRGGGLSLLSRQYAMYWLVWLLLCGCFAIRHTSKLLDAASQQHALLAQPTTTTAAAAAVPNPMQQHSSSSSSTAGNASTGAAAVLASQHRNWPDGYVAVCAVIKDQWPDLRYWIEYHRCEGMVGGRVMHECSAPPWKASCCFNSCQVYSGVGKPAWFAFSTNEARPWYGLWLSKRGPGSCTRVSRHGCGVVRSAFSIRMVALRAVHLSPLILA